MLGETLTAVPDELRQLNIRLRTGLAEQLKAMATAQNLSVNQFIVKVLEAAVGQRQGPLPLEERLQGIEARLDAIEQRII